MKLADKPGHTDLTRDICPLPLAWRRFLTPWSTFAYKKNDFGLSLIQELEMDGFSFFIWRLQIDKPVRLYPMAEKPTIALQFTRLGNIPCMLRGFGEKILRKGSYEIFYVPRGYNEAWFKPGIYESQHIELEPQYLNDVSTSNPRIAELVNRFRESSESGIPMAVGHINYITEAIINNMNSCKEPPGGLKLEMHKYILELLSEYLANIYQREQELYLPQGPYKELMIRIKDSIQLEPSIHDHTQTSLAQSFGISETLLKRLFKMTFGETISQFVRSQALAKARYLLSSTTRSIEDIAVEVGYSSREALDRSFKKLYGKSPANLRTNFNG